jgi:superfamily II DNA or RNA helicase
MYKARPYQTPYIDNAIDLIDKHNRLIMCAPTGAGKTVIFTLIIEKLINDGHCVFLLTDSRTLLTQSVEALENQGHKGSFIAAKMKMKAGMPFYACTAQTLIRRESDFLPTPTIFIVDEAHSGHFTRVLTEKYPDIPAIGFTATPVNSEPRNEKKHLKNYYNECFVGCDIPSLIASGHLAACTTFVPENMQAFIDGQDMGISEFNALRQLDLMKDYDLFNKGVTEYKTKGKREKALCFVANINSIFYAQRAFEAQNISVSFVHSKMPDHEKQKRIKEFEQGDTEVMINCGILTKGYNYPPITDIILLRLTSSLSLFLQMCGRGSRVTPDKKTFNVFDICGNTILHSTWDSKKDWHKIFWYPEAFFGAKNKNGGLAPTKNCPKCDAFLPASISACKYCGYEYPTKEAEKAEKKEGGENTEEAKERLKNKLPSLFSKSLYTMLAKVKAGEKNEKYLFHAAFKHYYWVAEKFLLQNGYKKQDFEYYQKKFHYHGKDLKGKNNVIVMIKKKGNNYIAVLFATKKNIYKVIKPTKSAAEAAKQAQKAIKKGVAEHVFYYTEKLKIGKETIERVSPQLKKYLNRI